jgi:hypothetical protein
VARTVPLDWRSRIDGKVGRPKPEEPVGAAGMASSSEDIDRYMLNLLRRQRGGERITIEIGPHTALTLVGAIQWVMRRSDQLNVYAPAMFESFLAELRRVFADEPAALDMIKLHEPPTEAR